VVDPSVPVFLFPAPEAARQAQPEALAPRVQALPRGEPGVQHVAAAVQRAPPGAVQALRREAAAARDEVRQAAVAALAGAGERREVPGAVAGRGLPSAVVWALPWVGVFRRDQALPGPAPLPAAWFARAMGHQQSASPSKRWWQAATNEVLS